MDIALGRDVRFANVKIGFFSVKRPCAWWSSLIEFSRTPRPRRGPLRHKRPWAYRWVSAAALLASTGGSVARNHCHKNAKPSLILATAFVIVVKGVIQISRTTPDDRTGVSQSVRSMLVCLYDAR